MCSYTAIILVCRQHYGYLENISDPKSASRFVPFPVVCVRIAAQPYCHRVVLLQGIVSHHSQLLGCSSMFVLKWRLVYARLGH